MLLGSKFINEIEDCQKNTDILSDFIIYFNFCQHSFGGNVGTILRLRVGNNDFRIVNLSSIF